MRVGIATYHLDVRGGTQRVVLNLARGLQARGHHVRLFALTQSERCFPELQDGLDIVAVQRISDEMPAHRRSTATSHASIIASKLTRVAGDLRHQLEAETAFRSMFAQHGADLDVWNPHEGGGLPWACLSHAPKERVVWQCNEPLGRNSFRDLGTRALRRAFGLAQMLYPPIALDAVRMRGLRWVSVLDEKTARIVRARYGIDPTVIRCGPLEDWLDSPRDGDAGRKLRERLAIPSDCPVVGAVGHWTIHKRYEDIVRAIALVPERNAHFVMFGPRSLNPAYASFVEGEAKRLGLQDRFHVLDYVPADDAELRATYDAFDVFCFPAAPQTWGLAPLEAMARALPVVVSDGCGAAEIIEEGRTGLVHKARDVADLARCLDQLLASSDLRVAFGQNARAAVSERYAFSRYVDGVESLLKRAAQAARSR